MIDFQSHVDKIMDGLNNEVAALHKWFRQDFPESRLEVAVDLNKITRSLTIQTKVLTGKEMTDNQKSMFNKIIIKEKDFLDPLYMGSFLRMFNQELRKSISHGINLHYHQEKVRLIN